MADLNDPKNRLIFALDVPGIEDAVRYAKLLEGSIGCFKVGLELFISEGPQIITALREHSGADIFLDLKLHDIPATVQRAVKSAVRHNVQYLTVHCGSGQDMLRSAVLGVGDSALRILGVTVLTSTGAEQMTPSTGTHQELQLADLVVERTRRAQAARCHGVVCSGQEVEYVKRILGDSALAVVPGIRPEWAVIKKDDQSRITTPTQAIQSGADLLVVGRPIRDADDPKGAADRIVDEIASALNEAGK